MEVKITYSKEQLKAAVDFISENNPHYVGKKTYIRASILKNMRRLAKDPEGWIAGTMGYVLWGDREFEGVDRDFNTIHFEISINPSLGCEDITIIEETVHG